MRKKINHGFKKGFTLVELIVYMSLLGILLIVLTDILVAVLDTRLRSEATNYVEQDSRYILSRLTRSINQLPSNWEIISPGAFGSSSGTLTYQVPLFPITYELSGDDLEYNYPNLSPPPAGLLRFNVNSSETTVTNLNFTKLGDTVGKESIKIKFTVTSKTTPASGPASQTIETTVSRR